ncbi:MAG TPA: c-type cytochrome domain-containing protein, partial [Chitinophagaceae bacterium]|nr:c-type cytochrome domain-containing protein [Chitinophagaceae bacterium]
MTELIGHLHPLLVHLPIGVLLLGCFFQLLVLRPAYAYLQPAIGITLFWGMLTAVAACITGYLLSGSGDYDEQLVGRHQWFGIAVAATAAIYYGCYRFNLIRKYTWALPLVLILLVSITGHLGGTLTHGSDYLSGSFTNIGVGDAPLPERPVPDVQEAVAYTDLVQPLLQRKCYSCHGPNKQKGKLRMDQVALLMKGGKDGVVLQPGNAEKSELMQRLLLDKADEKHMPPKEKP